MEEVKPFKIIHEVGTVESKILKFRSDISNKNVIACLGNTRSGKSTLINLILDNELAGFKSGKRFLIKSESNGNGPPIRHGCTSHTKYPSVWQSQNDVETVFVDFPGFDDNRGIIRNVINILFMNQLTHAIAVKFVIVSDIKDLINDNINELATLLSNLEHVITDFRAVSFIFTKASEDITVSKISLLMEEKFLNVYGLAVKTDLVTYLAENPDQIGILRAPLREGPINTEEIDCNLKISISNNNFARGNSRFILPACTHRVLLDLYRKCIEDLNFETEISVLLRAEENFFNIDKYVFASTDQELEATKNKLTALLDNIRERNTVFFTMIRGVYESVLALKQHLSEPFEKKLKFLKFMDELSLLDENIIKIVIDRYRHVLSELNVKITNLLEKINAELTSRLEEGLEHLQNVVRADVNRVIDMASVYTSHAQRALEAIGYDISWISNEAAANSAGTFGICLLGATGFAAGAYATHYCNTTHLRKKLRMEQGRS